MGRLNAVVARLVPGPAVKVKEACVMSRVLEKPLTVTVNVAPDCENEMLLTVGATAGTAI